MAVYTIAGISMEIDPKTDFSKHLLRDFLTPDAAPVVQITPCPGEAEEIGLLRRVGLELLQNHDGMYIHGAVVLYKGLAYLFTATSGTGKSTHVQLWKQLLGDRVRILNGDKPLLRRINGRIMVCGSPWRGKEGWGENTDAPLCGIFVLRRSTADRVEQLSDLEILDELLCATIYPEDPELTQKLLELIGHIMESVPVRALYCTPNLSAAQTAVRFIEGDEA